MLQRVQETLGEAYSNDGLARSRQSLEEAKRGFLREMNKTDPSWREKMRVRKLEEIQRMEQLKVKVGRELEERQRQL